MKDRQKNLMYFIAICMCLTIIGFFVGYAVSYNTAANNIRDQMQERGLVFCEKNNNLFTTERTEAAQWVIPKQNIS